MKKKIGRPKVEKFPPVQELPKWAVKRIEDLSNSSGVSPRKILELSLKMGLYAVAEQYGGLIEFQASADKLFFGEPDEPLPATRDPEETVQPGDTPDEPPPEPAPDLNGEVERLEQPELEETAENGSFASALQ